MLYNIYFGLYAKNYFADNQRKVKNMQFFIAKNLVIQKNVVPLHPQSREIAAE